MCSTTYRRKIATFDFICDTILPKMKIQASVQHTDNKNQRWPHHAALPMLKQKTQSNTRSTMQKGQPKNRRPKIQLQQESNEQNRAEHTWRTKIVPTQIVNTPNNEQHGQRIQGGLFRAEVGERTKNAKNNFATKKRNRMNLQKGPRNNIGPGQ